MLPIFIGRFQPFHKGHLEAIKWILKREKRILIVIGSLQEFQIKDNPFSFKERKEMIEGSLLRVGIKNFKIYGVPDFFNDTLWTGKILEIAKLKKNEVTIFTKNFWTKRCFEKIGTRVKTHPLFFSQLSGVKIRKKIFKNERWKSLVPKEVLEYLKKIKGIGKVKLLQELPEKKIVKFIKKEVKRSELKGGIVGISGGIDSSVMAYLAKKALGEKVVFLWMPFVKNCLLQKNVLSLEKKLKAKIRKIYLEDAYRKFLKSVPKGNRISEGNLKSRIRMAALYYFANLYDLLVVGTTNKSEAELGYFTKFGDGGVDIEPIGDLYKTEVIEMAKRLKLPKEIIETTPTAELWFGQTDEKEIGLNYQKLDTILKLLSQDFKEKEISFLTNISQSKIKDITERKRKNTHKLSLPSVCEFKNF